MASTADADDADTEVGGLAAWFARARWRADPFPWTQLPVDLQAYISEWLGVRDVVTLATLLTTYPPPWMAAVLERGWKSRKHVTVRNRAQLAQVLAWKIPKVRITFPLFQEEADLEELQGPFRCIRDVVYDMNGADYGSPAGMRLSSGHYQTPPSLFRPATQHRIPGRVTRLHHFTLFSNVHTLELRYLHRLDLASLARVKELTLFRCWDTRHVVVDASPLVNVPRLTIRLCHSIRDISTLKPAYLRVTVCHVTETAEQLRARIPDVKTEVCGHCDQCRPRPARDMQLFNQPPQHGLLDLGIFGNAVDQPADQPGLYPPFLRPLPGYDLLDDIFGPGNHHRNPPPLLPPSVPAAAHEVPRNEPTVVDGILRIDYTYDRNLATHPGPPSLWVTVTLTSLCDEPLTHIDHQVAVPRYMELQMFQAESTTLPPRGTITQTFLLGNTTEGRKVSIFRTKVNWVRRNGTRDSITSQTTLHPFWIMGPAPCRALPPDVVDDAHLQRILATPSEPSRVAVGAAHRVDPAIRQSETWPHAELKLGGDESLVKDWIAETLELPATGLRFGTGKLLRYRAGCFFAQHTDGCVGPDHVGTAVLLAPRTWHGGDLRVDGRRVATHPTQWTLAAFRLGVRHEVTRVTHGERVAYKFEVLHDQQRVASRLREGSRTLTALGNVAGLAVAIPESPDPQPWKTHEPKDDWCSGSSSDSDFGFSLFDEEEGE